MIERTKPGSFEDEQDSLVLDFARSHLDQGNIPGLIIGGVNAEGHPVVQEAIYYVRGSDGYLQEVREITPPEETES